MMAARKSKTLIAEESDDEKLLMLAIQVEHTHTLVEAIGRLLVSAALALRAEEEADPKVDNLPEVVRAAFDNLEQAMAGQ